MTAAQDQCRAVHHEGGRRSGAACQDRFASLQEGALEVGTSFQFSENKAKGVPAASLTGRLKVFYFSDEGLQFHSHYFSSLCLGKRICEPTLPTHNVIPSFTNCS